MANFAQLNVLNHALASGSTLSEGNLRIQSESTSDVGSLAYSTLEMASGKFYMEVLVVRQDADRGQIGIVNTLVEQNQAPNNTNITDGNNEWGFLTQSNVSNGSIHHGGSNIGNGAMGSFQPGDIAQVAIDASAGKVWFGRNNTWFANDGGSDGDPSTDANPTYTNLANGPYRFAVGCTNAASGLFVMKANFGEQGFKYTPPTGFKALSQDNLPTPTNFDALSGETPADYFKAVEYTGTGNSTAVTGLNFRPDFVWIKNHTTAGWSNLINDSIRGPNNLIFSDATNANTQNNGGGYLTSFDANGFTVSGGGASSRSGSSHIAWCFKAGGAPTATNSAGAGAVPTANSVKIDGANKSDALAGTIPATELTASTKSGFSIVRYTGTGSNGTVAHGLTAAPKWMWIKNLSGTNDHIIYHDNLVDATYYIALNQTAAQAQATNVFNSADPTSTVFSVGTSTATNGNGNDYIAYCWHDVEGFSRFGQFRGNAANNGPYVECGFKPAFVIVRNRNITTQWYSHDNVLGNKLGNDSPGLHLKPNSANATDSPVACDFFASGFKIRTTGSGQNGNGNTMLFMAFAEMPAKFV